jgi:hypothetical protein
MLTSNQPRSLASIYEPEPVLKNFHITTPPPPGERQPEAKPAASHPEGKALAAKLAAALGDETKLQSIKAIASTYTRTQKTPQGNVSMSMQSTVVFPDRLHVEGQGPMRGFTIVVSPNLSFTSTTSMRVRQMMPESQKKETLLQLKRDPIYIGQHASDPAFSFSSEGTEKIGDINAQILDVNGDGVSVRCYLDPQTGRVLRESYRTMEPSGPVPTETDLEDWKTSDGLTLPYLRKTKKNGEHWSTTQYTVIQINPIR